MPADRGAATDPSWVRYGGLAAMLAAGLEAATSLLVATLLSEAYEPGTRDALVVGDLVVTYLLLGLLGALAVYGRYGDVLGWTGNLGLFTIVVGGVLGVAVTVLDGVAPDHFLNLALVLGGAALLGVGLWRIPRAPRSAAALLGLAPVLAVIAAVATSLAPGGRLGPVGSVVVSLVWGAAWVVLGYHLWRSPGRTGAAATTGPTRT